MSLHYNFPVIKTINDVLPAIKDRDEFIVVKKDGYIVINYLVNYEDTFSVVHTKEDAIRRECRGLIFDLNGNLISRRYHKFFNVGEKEDIQLNDIDLNLHHKILFKLDGSMISFAEINGELRALTKMGITDVSIQVDNWIKNKPNYLKLLDEFSDSNLTFIFEWCSPHNPIIIKHETSKLILTAVRFNYVGNYCDYDWIKQQAKRFNIDCVEEYKTETKFYIKKLTDVINNEKDIEGVVVRFSTGHMIKIKTLDYMAMSRARDSIVREKNVVNLIINDKLDDVIPFMAEHDRENAIKFKDEFLKNKKLIIEQLINDVQNVKESYVTKKDFSINCSNNQLKYFAFNSWDNPRELVGEVVDNLIKGNVGSQPKIDSVRWLWNGVKWEFDWTN